MTDLTADQLQAILPQAYPFILLDRVTDIQKGKSLTAIKNITADEWPFSDAEFNITHYPETLLIEAAAQAALVLYRVGLDDRGLSEGLVLAKFKTEFFHRVLPGDSINIFSEVIKIINEGGLVESQIFNESELIAKSRVFAAVKKNERN